MSFPEKCPPPSPVLVDATRMARIAGLSKEAVDRLRKQGVIPYLRIESRVLFDPEAVLSALRMRFAVREGKEASA